MEENTQPKTELNIYDKVALLEEKFSTIETEFALHRYSMIDMLKVQHLINNIPELLALNEKFKYCNNKVNIFLDFFKESKKDYKILNKKINIIYSIFIIFTILCFILLYK